MLLAPISKYQTAILLSLLCLIIYFPLFLHLGYMPIRLWDESIYGVNAIEMAHNHNYVVTYFYGNPDIEVKPPLLMWCIIFFSKWMGFNELSLRLPSALAALALCIYLFFTLRKIADNSFFGFFTVCVLITCQGYVRNHVTRTGECESLLVLFSTVFSLELFLAVESADVKRRSRHLFLFFVFLTLAVLTKGIACLMLTPGLFIYCLIRKQVMVLLRNKAFYAGLAVFAVFGLGYYFLRESLNPGYLARVWHIEMGGRITSVFANEISPRWLYLNEMVTWQFVNYIFIFPVALALALKFAQTPVKRLVCFSFLAGTFYLGIISLAATKYPHYDAPLFPFLAIIIASFFYLLYTFSAQQLGTRVLPRLAIPISFFCVLCLLAKPYSEIISKVYFPVGDPWEEGFSVTCKYFQQAATGQVPVNGYKLVFDAPKGYGSSTVLTCYEEELRNKGFNPQIVKRAQLMPGDKAIVFDPWMKHLIEEDFEIEQPGILTHARRI